MSVKGRVHPLTKSIKLMKLCQGCQRKRKKKPTNIRNKTGVIAADPINIKNNSKVINTMNNFTNINLTRQMKSINFLRNTNFHNSSSIK